MEQIKVQTHGLASALAGFGMLVCMLLGLSGTLYKLLAPGGWIAQVFGRSVSAGMTLLATLAFIGVVAWLSRGAGSYTARSRLADAFVYGFTAVGLLYGVRFWLTGEF